MARLPQPGADAGSWGTTLNDFLSVSHASAGQVKAGVVSEGNFASAVQATLNTTSVIADGSIDETKLSSNVQATIDGKADASSLAAVATSGDYTNLSNKPVITDPDVVSVLVTSGNETRPADVSTVLWIGGDEQPTNMAIGDFWFTPNPGVPSVPTDLQATSVDVASFTLSWSASTGENGVSGYEVRQDGSLSLGIITATSKAVTGLTGATEYTYEVRARDVNGNWSDWSAPLAVTTTTPVAAEYSVFGNTYPKTLTQYNDGGGTLQLATSFYVSTTDTWQVTGGRFYVPSNATNVGSLTAKVGLQIVSQSDPAPPTMDWTPIVNAFGTVATVTPGAWHEVRWDPFPIDKTQLAWIYLMFSDGATYFDAASPSEPATESSQVAGLYQSGTTDGDNPSWRRSWNNLGGQRSDYYSIDILATKES